MTDTYDWLFQKRAIGSKTAPNLLVLHPLERFDGTDEGKPRESAYEWYRQLAAGKWGILFVECTTCSDNPADRGHSPDGFLMTESNLPEFQRLVREIKEISPETVLMIQRSTGHPENDMTGTKNFMELPTSENNRCLTNMIKGSIVAAEAGFDGCLRVRDQRLLLLVREHGHRGRPVCRSNEGHDLVAIVQQVRHERAVLVDKVGIDEDSGLE